MVTSSRPHTSRTDAPSSRAQRCGVGAANARRRGLLRGLSSLGRLITGRLRGRRRTGSSLGRLRLRLRASHLQAFSLIQLAWRHGGMSGRLLERDTHTTHARDALAALSRRNRTLGRDGRSRATTMWELAHLGVAAIVSGAPRMHDSSGATPCRTLSLNYHRTTRVGGGEN